MGFSRQARSTPTLISSATADVVALPGGGWSPKGDYLALIEHEGTKPLLSVVNVKRGSVAAFPVLVDTRAHWRGTLAISCCC